MRRMTSILTLVLASATLTLASATAWSEDGGPDKLEVTGLTTKKHLNVRNGPSLKHDVINGLVMGEVVKNLGCATSADGRWCNVELKDGTKGYSFGQYLKEAAAAAAQPAAPPAKFALGTLKCEKNNGTPMADCSYGVMRAGVNMGSLQITWPDATKRMFGIYHNVVSTADGVATAKVGADGSYDITLTPKGAASEHYMVPAGVILTK